MNYLKHLYDQPVFKRELPAANQQLAVADIIRWWESRRIFFNLIVGCTGIIACIFMLGCAIVSEPIVGEAIGMSDSPLLGIIGICLYGLLANLFYTSGWMTELAIRTIATAEKSSAIAVQTFRAGVTFSILLTFSPAVLCWVAFAIALHNGQTHSPAPE